MQLSKYFFIFHLFCNLYKLYSWKKLIKYNHFYINTISKVSVFGVLYINAYKNFVQTHYLVSISLSGKFGWQNCLLQCTLSAAAPTASVHGLSPFFLNSLCIVLRSEPFLLQLSLYRPTVWAQSSSTLFVLSFSMFHVAYLFFSFRLVPMWRHYEGLHNLPFLAYVLTMSIFVFVQPHWFFPHQLFFSLFVILICICTGRCQVPIPLGSSTKFLILITVQELYSDLGLSY